MSQIREQGTVNEVFHVSGADGDVIVRFTRRPRGHRGRVGRTGGALDSIRPGRLGPLTEDLDRIMVSDENRPDWSWVGADDPASDLGKLDAPILLMFGDRDTDHPTELKFRRWR